MYSLHNQDFIITDQDTIRTAMLKIDHNSKGIVYVVKGNILIGSITDGDIRRCLISNGNDLTINVMSVANKSVHFLSENEAYKAREELKRWQISSIPIVDTKGEIQNIVFIDGSQTKKAENLNVPLVIMAGGKGTRLKPYTDILPKPLIPMGNMTIIEYIMDRFSEYGCDDVHIIVNYKKELIKAFLRETDRRISFYDEEYFGGTGGGLRLLKGTLNQTFFMTNCDILIEEDYGKILQYHRERQNLATMVCAQKQLTVPYGVVKLDQNGDLLHIEEKPSHTYLTNTGLYVLEPEFIRQIPQRDFIHITDIIEICQKEKYKIGVYVIPEEKWMDMGELEEMEKMKHKLGLS